MKFEYVMSGVAHIRVTYTSVYNFPRVVESIRKANKAVQGLNNHGYSYLYNGYTEEIIGKNFKIHYDDVLENIYSDSGGLQAITRGHDIDSEMKQRVYNAQLHSDVAMSFDEIPLKIVGESRIGDLSNRFFDPEYFVEAAKLSAKNLEEQIDFFNEKEAHTRPLLIVQGNDIDYFCKWTDIVLKNIPQEKWKYIAGISISGAAIGSGILETVERLYSLVEMPAPDEMKKHLHLLGVGSVDRLLPLGAFALGGLYPEDMTVSYDSTTHSSGVTMGRYLNAKGKQINYGRHDYTIINNILDEIIERFPGYIDDIDRDMARVIMTTARNVIFDMYPNHDIEYYYHNLYNLLSLLSVTNFTANVNQTLTSLKDYKKRCAHKKRTYLIPLSEVKNREDYNHWYRQVKPYIHSQRVEAIKKTNNLEAFFG